MRKIWPWLAGLIVILVLGLFVLLGVGYLSNRGFLTESRVVRPGIYSNNWHHHGFGMRWGLPFRGVLGGLLFLLVSGGLLALIIGGVYLIVRSKGKGENRIVESYEHSCPNCGKEVKTDWHICPYCGENLREE